jgi:hypothetical protein
MRAAVGLSTIFSLPLESLASAGEVREVGVLRDDRFGDRRCVARRFGLWLSLVERCVRDAEAVGSNPTSPTFFITVERRIFAPLAGAGVVTDARQRPASPTRVEKPGFIFLRKSAFICGLNR